MAGLKKERKLSDIAGSRTITREDWERVTKAFELQRKLDKERVKRLNRQLEISIPIGL